jgi:hypothetical protein
VEEERNELAACPDVKVDVDGLGLEDAARVPASASPNPSTNRAYSS